MPTEPYRAHFRNVWQSASPLESVLAEKIIERAGNSVFPRPVLRALKEIIARLNLDARCVDALLPHLAFRHSCSVVLVVGLPGSGKSYVRQRLAAKLAALSIKSRSLTDYVFAYRDFVHDMIMLGPARGFAPHAGGGFIAPSEAALAPALRSLAVAVIGSLRENEVTLVEFIETVLRPYRQGTATQADRPIPV